MTHDQVVLTLAYLYPNVEWSYDGDGTTLDPVPGVSHGLTWHSDTPPPVLADLEAAWPTVDAQPKPPTQAQKVAQALAAIENDASLDQATRDALTKVVEALS